MEVAHRYLPVGDSVVGGDWHDIVALPGGRAALIVGDAMGHGPEAAAVMVQLRTAAHTLADLELAPGEVLRRLDRMAAGSPPRRSRPASTPSSTRRAARAWPPRPVTCRRCWCCPTARRGCWTCRRACRWAWAPTSFQATEVSLPPGATLALYTDGLVESRTRPLDDGMAALRDALGSALARPGARWAAPATR